MSSWGNAGALSFEAGLGVGGVCVIVGGKGGGEERQGTQGGRGQKKINEDGVGLPVHYWQHRTVLVPRPAFRYAGCPTAGYPSLFCPTP